jgi:hypothetical protein
VVHVAALPSPYVDFHWMLYEEKPRQSSLLVVGFKFFFPTTCGEGSPFIKRRIHRPINDWEKEYFH